MLKHHLKRLINFVSVTAFDQYELEDHNTTTWFSHKGHYKIKSYEEFREIYHKETHEPNPNFIDMLPIKIVVKINSSTSRSHNWLLNRSHKYVPKSKHHMTALCEYLEILETLQHCNGYQSNGSYKRFHSRKCLMNKCKGQFNVNTIFDRLFHSA